MIFLAIVIIGLLAFIPPRLLATEDFKDSENMQFAKDALQISNLTLGNPVEQLLILSYGVTIEEVNGHPISAEVVGYTVFGIPYAVVVANKDGAYVKERFGK